MDLFDSDFADDFDVEDYEDEIEDGDCESSLCYGTLVGVNLVVEGALSHHRNAEDGKNKTNRNLAIYSPSSVTSPRSGSFVHRASSKCQEKQCGACFRGSGASLHHSRGKSSCCQSCLSHGCSSAPSTHSLQLGYRIQCCNFLVSLQSFTSLFGVAATAVGEMDSSYVLEL